ncbi:MAG: hypothetical protein CMH30_07380 [Micavibrio sp.]|nr:hypothetical protein [Micavibrio sp.]
MSNIFTIFMAIAMLACLGALIIGLLSFAKGGEFNKKHGNRLMRLRVLFQGIALAMFALAIITHS